MSLTAATLSMCLVSFHISLSPPLPTFGSFKRQKEKVGTKSVVAGMKFIQKYQRSLSNIFRTLSFAGVIEMDSQNIGHCHTISSFWQRHRLRMEM